MISDLLFNQTNYEEKKRRDKANKQLKALGIIIEDLKR